MSQHATARRLATGTGATLALAVVGVTATGGAAQADDSYTVRTGDTVSHIAVRTGTTVAAITRANALADASRIRIGQVLTIPTGSPAAATPAAPAPARPPRRTPSSPVTPSATSRPGSARPSPRSSRRTGSTPVR